MASTPNPDAGALEVVLAATDFSATALSGVAWAATLARSRGARLELVHVVHPLEQPLELELPADLTASFAAAARRRLEGLAGDLRTEDTEVGFRVLVGRPVQEILRRIDELSADLLVVGTRGLSGLHHLMLGSTAERLVQRSRCPVLCIHPAERAEPGGVTRVLVPTDFSADAERAVAEAVRVFALRPETARLTLFHAHQVLPDFAAYGYDTAGLILNGRQAVARAAAERLEERATRLRRQGLPVEIVVREGAPAEEIVAEATSGAYDAIAMGTRGRSALRHLVLGSTAERVVQRAPCPVLTVHVPRAEEVEETEHHRGELVLTP